MYNTRKEKKQKMCPVKRRSTNQFWWIRRNKSRCLFYFVFHRLWREIGVLKHVVGPKMKSKGKNDFLSLFLFLSRCKDFYFNLSLALRRLSCRREHHDHFYARIKIRTPTLSRHKRLRLSPDRQSSIQRVVSKHV